MVFVLTRTTKGERQRSAQWNDFHARGRLISTQLAYLRDVEGRRSVPGTPGAPRVRSVKRTGFLWRRSVSARRNAGGAPPDPSAPR